MTAPRWLATLALTAVAATAQSADPISESLATLRAQSPQPSQAPPPLPLPPSPPLQSPPLQQDPLEIFSAIAAEDATWLASLLAAGIDPNTPFPKPGPRDFTRFYEGTDLHYYLRTEPGFTPLMFAATIGNAPAVDALLAAGASKGRLTQRSKTSALYLAARAGHIAIMQTLMGITPDSEVSQYKLHVSLGDQRVVLWKGDKIILFSKISSGKESTPTEPGTYLVTSKHKDHTSTLFDARMPYFMRFSCGASGLHAGDLPGYAASHGCIRMPLRDAREFYEATPIGTLVVVD
jgi:lipoprotein-anchoring transpeptidase ErfK/SrfK